MIYSGKQHANHTILRIYIIYPVIMTPAKQRACQNFILHYAPYL